MRQRFLSIVGALLLSVAVASAQQDASTSGSLTAPAQSVVLDLNGYGTAAIQVTGTWDGQLEIEASINGTDYFTWIGTNLATLAIVPSIVSNGEFTVSTGAFTKIRVRASALTSGTAQVAIVGGSVTQVPYQQVWDIIQPISADLPELPTPAVAADNTANPSISKIGVYPFVFDGSTWDRWTGANRVWDGTDTANVTGTSLDVNCTGGCGGAVSFLDDDAFTFGTTAINVTGAVVDDVATNAVAENSAGAPRMSPERVLFGNLRTATGTELLGQQAMAGSLPVAIASDQLSRSATGSLTLVNDAVTMDTSGLNVVEVQFPTVVGSGTQEVEPQLSNDGGTTWVDAVAWFKEPTDYRWAPPRSAPADIGLFPSNASFLFNVAGFNRLRLRLTVADGNTATVAMHGSTAADALSVVGDVRLNDLNGTPIDFLDTTPGISFGTSDNPALPVWQIGNPLFNNTDAQSPTTALAAGASAIFAFNGVTFDRMRGTVNGGLWVNSTDLQDATALADNFANPTTAPVGAFGMAFDGSTWDRLRGDSTNGLLVNLGTNNDVTITSGTVTADTELAAAAALADNFANPTTAPVGAFGMVWDGSNWDRMSASSAAITSTTARGANVRPVIGASANITITSTPTNYLIDAGLGGGSSAASIYVQAGGSVNPRFHIQAWTQPGAGTFVPYLLANPSGTQHTVVAAGTQVTAAGTYIVPLQGFTGLQLIGVANDSGTSAIFVSVAPGSVYMPVGTQAVDGELAAAAALTDNFANPTTAPVGAFNMVWDGSAWDRWDGTVTILDGQTLTVAGAQADGALALDNPVQIGGVDGSGNVQAVRTDTTGELQVDVLTLPAVTATNLDIRDLTFAADKVDASGTVLGASTNNIGDVDVLTFPDNEPINVAQVGGTAVVAPRCLREEPTYVTINQTTGTQLATGVSGERIYICSFQVFTGAAQNVALVSGTGTVCGTGTSGVLGGPSAATGWNWIANQGIALASADNPYGRTGANADNLCLLQSAAGQISGSLTYVSQ